MYSLTDWLIGLGSYTVLIIAMIYALVPIRKEQKISYNPINRMFMFLILTVGVMYSLRFISFTITTLTGITGLLDFGVALNFTTFVTIILQMLLFTFILFIYNIKRLITLPLIAGFFMNAYIYWFEIQFLTITILIMTVVNILFFIYKGVKNKNGTIFGTGLALISIFTWSLIYLVVTKSNNITGPLYYVGAMIGMLLLGLGTHGWIEKHILYDRAREAAIRNMWVARIVQKEDEPVSNIVAQKRIHIQCPVCQTTNKHVFSKEYVKKRMDDGRGIVVYPIHQAGNCGHSFLIYIDKKFSIRATEPFEDFEPTINKEITVET